MGMMKKLKLFSLCTQQPKTTSFRANLTNQEVQEEMMINKAINSANSSGLTFTNSSESPLSTPSDRLEFDELSSSSLSISGEDSHVEAVIRGAQKAGNLHRLLFEPTWAPRSVTVEMDSDDPREDFKRSMEEMVECLGVSVSRNDCWQGLEELLSWYLKVNDKSSYGYILGAFVDLVYGIFGHVDEINKEVDETSFCSAASSSLSSSSSSSA